MAANEGRKLRRLPTVASNPAARGHELSGLHFQASRRIDEIIEQVRDLQSAGKPRQVKTLLKQVAGIKKGLRALEAHVRKSSRVLK